jgi:membrane protease YdiL (CAAX protease family)
MSVERIRSWFWSLGKFDSIVALTIVTILSLLLFRLPLITHFKGIYFNDSFQYLLVTIFVLGCVLIVRPPTIAYFGWPRIRWVGAFALVVAAGIVALSINSGYMIRQPLRVKIAGVISLLMIGFGEELLSRVLVFGSLQRFGTKFAVLVSSAMFGLMHINVYLPDWSGWDAYWHVMSTFGFGIFACALFMATRSYWIVAVFHALSDWTVIFDREYRGEDTTYFSPIWENLGSGVMGFITSFGPIGLAFLWIMRGRWPKWAIRLAIKWKLVEQAAAVTPSKSRWSRNRLFRRT